MKKNIIIILLVAIIALGGFWIWKNQSKKVEKQGENKKEIEIKNTLAEVQKKDEEANKVNNINESEKVVREYLKQHLDRLNKKSPVNNDLSLSLVTSNFVNNFNKLKKPLFYDPFICAQDYPNDINNASIILEEITGSSATFKVKIDKNWAGEPNKMQLIKDKNVWKIDKIICSTSGGIF